MKKIMSFLAGRKVKEVVELFNEELSMTRKIFWLCVLSALLGGLVIGMLISPNKKVSIGCNNGNNNNISSSDDEDDDDSDEEKKSRSKPIPFRNKK